ncbi:MAG: methyl-accepting chemotaxis protein [Agathobacter sp.]|nr:methyl-accepting chemotaxis protein [Agathobacter sp.]
MFGSRKNKRDEQIKDIFDHIYQQRVVFETSVSQVEEGRKRVYNDICQVMTNTNQLTTHAMLNIEEEAKTIHNIDEFSKDLIGAVEEYGQLKMEVGEQLQAVTALVEENKHFTSPAKYLSEVPNALRQNCQSYAQQLDDMTEYGKRMGVLALNAAIEAGRLGEGGRGFVLAAEEIRQTAVSYEKAAATMKEEVEASREKIAEMEETIAHLISLMKESNVGTAKLFKKCQETQKIMENSGMRDFSEDMILIRDQVVKMRNLDEEIAKCAERNKIQLSDIQEDIQNQKQELAEMESDLLFLLDSAEEQLQ